MASPPKLPNLPKSSKPLSLTEFVPIRSGKISVLRSGLLVPGAVTIAVSLTLFVFFDSDNATAFFSVFGAYLIFILLWAIYVYSRSDKPLVALLWPASVTAVLMLVPWLFAVFSFVFRTVLPGHQNIFFVSEFFGAGLLEELLKAVPTLIGLWITLGWRGPHRSLTELIRVRGPLDGVLFGVAAGGTFMWIETLLEYAPKFGPLLTIPRLLNPGHMAYAGIFGYFIGLAAIRPGSLPLLLATGWISAAVLHALWDTGAGYTWVLAISSAAAFICFVACLLKARQLDGQVSHHHLNPADHSIAVGPPPLPPSLRSAVPAQPAAPGPPAAAPVASDATFQLLVEGRIIPLRPGLQMDLGRLPGLTHAKGIIFAVTTHPKDPAVLGLQNLGTLPWNALIQGAPKTIDPQRNIRVAHGTLIAFGSVQGSIQQITAHQ